MTNTPMRPRGVLQKYTTADGLAGDRVEHIAEDADGYLWIGTTSNGASRFDGDEFQTFSMRDGLTGSQIYWLHLDSKGRLWFGVNDGSLCWYEDGVFHTLDDRAPSGITCIMEDRQGRLWMAGVGIFGFFDGSRFRDCELAGSTGLANTGVCWCLAEDAQGRIYVITDNHLVQYDQGRFTSFGAEQGLPLSAAIGWRNTLNFDPDIGEFWIGMGHEIGRWNGESYQTIRPDTGEIRKIQRDRRGRTWFATLSQKGALCFDGTDFFQLGAEVGFPEANVNGIYEDREGSIWIGSWGEGLYCYDGDHISLLNERDGLPAGPISSLLTDRRGQLWMGMGEFGYPGEGVSCYDGHSLVKYPSAGGFKVVSCEDGDGQLWFGDREGLLLYDGQTFRRLDPVPELRVKTVFAVYQRTAGELLCSHNVWDKQQYPKWALRISRCDGQQFHSLWTIGEGDRGGNEKISAMLETRRGELFVACGCIGGLGQSRGLGRLGADGDFRFYTTEDGLVDNRIEALHEDRQGLMWIATVGGLSHFDGESFVNFTSEHGLPHDYVHCICEDDAGHLWFGTDRGVVRYDGQYFQVVHSPFIGQTLQIIQDEEGGFWLGTRNALVQYMPGVVPPQVRILQVIADQIYERPTEFEVSTAPRQLVFEYKGLGFRTAPRHMLYACRLQGHEEEWRPATREMRAYYQDVPPGDYVFQVKAIDRDLLSSEPAEVQVKITRDDRDEQIDELEQRVRERTEELEQTHAELRIAQQQLIDELEEELQTAHELQLGLMPTEAPRIAGLDLAGRCLTANHVGGDFYQYFERDGVFSLCLADVTGHAMEAAVPVMMFSGMLHTEMQYAPALDQLFIHLNRNLHRTLDRRTFICFAMGELQRETGFFRLANAGCPYPYHYSASTGQIRELQIDAYPLGVRAETEFGLVEAQLAPGDYVIYCSDGLIEASDKEGDMFGFERTAEVLEQGCVEGLHAAAMIEHLFGAVEQFSGATAREDDMTCVVLKLAE